MSSSYKADAIVVLKGLEAVKKRPGMYIGDTDDGSGLHHMVFEVVDNSVDEALAGFCTKIQVEVTQDGAIVVRDNGRGIPIDMHPVEKVSAAEVIMTRLHAGGKFNSSTYKVSGGLHGVGVSVVNALSTKLELTIFRDNKKYFIEFKDGIAVAPLKCVSEQGSYISGTSVKFYPSADIFKSVQFVPKTISKKLQELAFLNGGLAIELTYEGKTEKFLYEGGIKQFLEYHTRKYNHICKPIIMHHESKSGIVVDAALTWVEQDHESILCFTNNIPQRDGGTHLAACRAAISKTFVRAIQDRVKNKASVCAEDIREGLMGILSIKMPDPKFSSQTKDKLISSEVRTPIDAGLAKAFEEFIDFQIKDLNALTDRVLMSARAREAAKKAREIVKRKDVLSSILLPGKLADCQSKHPSESELYIVEGDSAGGSAKQARNRENQAILPIRGKILNVEKAGLVKLLSSKEIAALISAIGAGIDRADSDKYNFNIDGVRYHKVVIMTDADVDGSHIKTLLLTFFYRFMPALIENGYLYLAEPPLFHVLFKGKKTYFKDEKSLYNYLVERGLNKMNRDDVHKWRDFLLQVSGAVMSVKRLANRINVDTLIIESILYSGFHIDRTNQDKIIEFLNSQKSESDFHAVDLLKWSVQVESDSICIIRERGGFEVKSRITFEDLKELPDIKIPKLPIEFKFDNANALCSSISEVLDSIVEHGNKDITIGRYKGLGEMNPDQLWDTTLDPENRTMLRVKIDDAERADSLFRDLMGEDVAPRRAFIQNYVLSAVDIDV